MGSKVVTGTLTAANQVSAALQVEKDFNIALWGTFDATTVLERSFDEGATWLPCSLNTSGDQAAYTTALSATVFEPEGGVRYRWRCSIFNSGTISYRISQ
jgi:hypothetical protein